MAVISVRAKNFKKLKDLDEKFDGKTFAIVGDSEVGKTSLMQIIQASLMQQDFPQDPLTKGEQEGFFEVVHELDGIKYTVSRPFNNKKGTASKTRFTVRDENGGRHSLEDLLTRIFGKAFINSNFDYYQFFFECKSKEARFNYIVKAVGGDEVLTNIETINKKKRERGVLGTQRDVYATLIDNSPIHPESVEQDMMHYAYAMDMMDAEQIKDEILATRESVFNITTQLSVVKEGNEAFQRSEAENKGLAADIEALEKQIAEMKRVLEFNKRWQQENQPDFEYQAELEDKLSKVEETNHEIEREANIAYNDKINEINTFNKMRDNFETALQNFEKYNEVDKEWTKLDQDIKSLIEKNREIFKNKIPIPGLTIDEVDGKSIVMYEGLELCWENVSKGRSIRLAIEILMAINPKGNHIVMIPEAQSLGSQLDEILDECKQFGIQAIVEITERKQEFHIEFEEQFLGKEDEKPVKPKQTAKKTNKK